MKTADYLSLALVGAVLIGGYVYFTRNRGRVPSAFSYDTPFSVAPIRAAPTNPFSRPVENAAPKTPVSSKKKDCGCLF